MKNILFLAAVLVAQPLAAAEGEARLELSGYISAWTQDCAGGSCGLPKPGERNRPVTAVLGLPSAPGEAAAAHVPVKLALPDGSELAADLSLYAVCPYGGSAGCAGRYFQAQVSIQVPAGAFCAASLNAADFAPFPVSMCAAASPEGKRYGVTLHRQPL